MSLLPSLLPHRLVMGANRRAEERRQTERQARLYRAFVPAGGLVFDIGANVGNRIEAFLRNGARVVALEPQEKCVGKLRRRFGERAGVSIVQAAVGRREGKDILQLSEEEDVVATLSDQFVSRMQASGRFGPGRAWGRKIEVSTVTLDSLIARFGSPHFIKIDVEGFEPEVLAGLSQPVKALSFEWTPELADNARACVRRCCELGMNRFQASFGESMKFAFEASVLPPRIESLISLLAEEQVLFGDIYASVDDLIRV